jgi:hypothetical protein
VIVGGIESGWRIYGQRQRWDGASIIVPSTATAKAKSIHRLHSAYLRPGRISSGKVGDELGTSARREMADEVGGGVIMIWVSLALADKFLAQLQT